MFKSDKRGSNETDYGTGEDFCVKCDKIVEEAKKEIEDREAQVHEEHLFMSSRYFRWH